MLEFDVRKNQNPEFIGFRWKKVPRIGKNRFEDEKIQFPTFEIDPEMGKSNSVEIRWKIIKNLQSEPDIGIGAAIRDEKGSILGAVAKSVEGSFFLFLAECLALREGLSFAKEIECVNLEVETDAINVVSTVVENRKLSMEGPILEDVKQLLVQLRGTGIHHVCRSANLVAHLLARFGFNSNCTNVWISETPTVVSNAVSIDVIA
ncbi:hypothetical protein TIFTF001_022317 [Ficus carica]|uniref:RNase H type-1 domain-containing protein n=1 Tax=Ficus carica TaxID=3494 RepID=A0AA88ATH4_FICCA|nr:hypothetical protein TIFTF001_022317 [Ficus carica]